jgi:hypothetical protein
MVAYAPQLGSYWEGGMQTLQPMRFELNRNPLTAGEQHALHADTCAHGLDEAYWGAMDGLLTTGSRSDTPLVLRARRGGQLVGAAHLLECRRINQCLFPGALGRALDSVPMPSYYWARGDAAVDLLGNAGFVADGEDRDAFYREAVAFLNSRYLSGTVMDERDSRPAAECYETAMMDWGRCDVRPGSADALLASHGNLRRKIAKFRNKRGSIELVEGALAPAVTARVMYCLEQSAAAAPLRTPFQENYANMVRWASASGAPGIVHFLARVDDAIVGYHSYLRSGVRLHCLSGGFDRSRQSNYHAYENILLETMRYAEEKGLRHVAFGPVTNPSKAALMPVSAPFVLRFYSRFRVLRRAMSLIIPRSALRPATFAARASAAEAREVAA